jgi:AAA domain-containing protein
MPLPVEDSCDPVEALLQRLPPFRSLMDLRSLPVTPRPWLMEGVLPQGAITMLTSKPKAGKTTWLCHLIEAMFLGKSEFLGQALHPPHGALILSEEAEELWRDRCSALPDSANLHFMCQPFLGRQTAREWKDSCEGLVELFKRHGWGWLVIDPIANLIPGDENQAQAMGDFLQPLRGFTKLNVNVTLAHHPNKRDGADIYCARGSGALPGFVEVVIRMSGVTGSGLRNRVRKLETQSRLGIGTVKELYAILADEHSYQRLANVEEAELLGLAGVVKQFLESRPEQDFTQADLRPVCPWPDGHPPAENVLYNVLKDGVDRHWRRIGEGGRGNPFRYAALKTAPSPRS